MAPKHVPLRTCVQCQQVRPKRELVRIVRTPQGKVEIDERGKAAGRGAYLCRNRVCWDAALTRGRLDHALKTRLSDADRQRLLEYGQHLPCLDERDSSEKGRVLSEATGKVLSEVKGDEAAASVEG